jgi:hypothetical protein
MFKKKDDGDKKTQEKKSLFDNGSKPQGLFGIESNNDDKKSLEGLFTHINEKKDENKIEENKIVENKKIEEEEEMEIEDDKGKKEEESSMNSDKINNLWISDDEEIIDDDTDINKVIDYQMITKKAQKKDNNLNELNLLIIPELSEYYYKINSDIGNENISIELSDKIIEILSEKISKIQNDDEKKDELINLTIVYIYFDAFILHRDDCAYLMNLRDTMLYKYLIPIQIQIDYENKNKNLEKKSDVDTIINILKDIFFYLSMIDIGKASQKLAELNRIYESFISNNILGDKTLIFYDLFINIEKLIGIYNDIYKMKENVN